MSVCVSANIKTDYQTYLVLGQRFLKHLKLSPLGQEARLEVESVVQIQTNRYFPAILFQYRMNYSRTNWIVFLRHWIRSGG